MLRCGRLRRRARRLNRHEDQWRGGQRGKPGGGHQGVDAGRFSHDVATRGVKQANAADDDGEPRRRGGGVPAGAMQNLRRRHVIQLQRDRDVRNRPALDRRLPQRQSLPLAEAAEYRIDEGAVGHLGFEIGSPVRVATKADERTLVQLPPAKGIETVIAGYGQ